MMTRDYIKSHSVEITNRKVFRPLFARLTGQYLNKHERWILRGTLKTSEFLTISVSIGAWPQTERELATYI
jgi:hypothetical protein